MRLDGVEGFVDGGKGNGVEESDEGFDGGDGFCQVGIRGEQVAICGYNAVAES